MTRWTQEEFVAAMERDDRRHRRGEAWKFANLYRCTTCGDEWQWYKIHRCPRCRTETVVLVGPAERVDVAKKKSGGIGASAPPKKAAKEKKVRDLKQPDRAVIVLGGEIGKAIRAETQRRGISLTALGGEMWQAYLPKAPTT